jgi:hypothetical protein
MKIFYIARVLYNLFLNGSHATYSILLSLFFKCLEVQAAEASDLVVS